MEKYGKNLINVFIDNTFQLNQKEAPALARAIFWQIVADCNQAKWKPVYINLQVIAIYMQMDIRTAQKYYDWLEENEFITTTKEGVIIGRDETAIWAVGEPGRSSGKLYKKKPSSNRRRSNKTTSGDDGKAEKKLSSRSGEDSGDRKNNSEPLENPFSSRNAGGMDI